MRSSGNPTPTSTDWIPSTRWNTSTGGMDPPSRMITGSVPNTAPIARDAARTAGWSAGVTTGLPPCLATTSAITPGGVAARNAAATFSAMSAGFCAGTSRQVILADAWAGMSVLVPAPDAVDPQRRARPAALEPRPPPPPPRRRDPARLRTEHRLVERQRRVRRALLGRRVDNVVIEPGHGHAAGGRVPQRRQHPRQRLDRVLYGAAEDAGVQVQRWPAHSHLHPGEPA